MVAESRLLISSAALLPAIRHHDVQAVESSSSRLAEPDSGQLFKQDTAFGGSHREVEFFRKNCV
jgi:hypothetical protein